MAEKQKTSKARARGGRKDMRGINARRKAGLPAKAGKRKLPNMNGPHITSAFSRKRGMRLAALGVKFYERPIKWRNLAAKETS